MLSAFKKFCLVSDDRRELKHYLNRTRSCQTYIPETLMQQATKQMIKQTKQKYLRRA
jgi:hypothetical protein